MKDYIEVQATVRMNTYDGRLWKKEVAITAVWIELCLTNQEYIARKKWWSISDGLFSIASYLQY